MPTQTERDSRHGPDPGLQLDAVAPQGPRVNSMLGNVASGIGAGALQRKLVQRKNEGQQAQPVGSQQNPVQAPAAAPGVSGMVTKEIKATLDKTETTLHVGTAVEVVSVAGDKLHVKVWSGHKGAQTDIAKDAFRAEPALGHKDGDASAGRQDDASFRDLRGPLFGPSGKPMVGDVNQGYLGDCYLIAAMGAVAAQSPETIMGLFSPLTPGQPSYTISLYQLAGADAKGKKTFKRVSYAVDTEIPVYTKADGTAGGRPHYAGQGSGDLSSQAAGLPQPAAAKPLWPILLEKAYAIHRAGYQGGYATIGDQGGLSPAAMEALTGVASSPSAAVPAGDDAVIDKFKQYQDSHVAVVCGTLDHQTSTNATFTGSGQTYTTQLHAAGDSGGETSEIIKRSVRISDARHKVADATDNGTGLTGADVDAAGSRVDYGDGRVTVTYKAGKKPDAAADLHVRGDVRGLLHKDIRLHAWHAYMFERVDPQAKLLYFKNPWGTDHPKRGVTPAEFRQLFTGIESNNIREQPTKPGGGPAAH